MIKIVKTIDNISEYQCGELPTTAEKLDAPVTTEDMMKKSIPIAIALCLIMFLTMFIKIFMSKSRVIFPPMVLGGCFLGFLLIIVHEWLHAIVYPKEANVTIGKLKGKMVFVALASYPLRRIRFIFMCLLPFLLGIIPLMLFILSSPQETVFNGLMFGMACIGMVSPYPDVYNVILVLKQQALIKSCSMEMMYIGFLDIKGDRQIQVCLTVYIGTHLGCRFCILAVFMIRAAVRTIRRDSSQS